MSTIHVLNLCESRRLMLTPGRSYRFEVDTTCVECLALADKALGREVQERFALIAPDPNIPRTSNLLTYEEVVRHCPDNDLRLVTGEISGRWAQGTRIIDVDTSETIAVVRVRG